MNKICKVCGQLKDFGNRGRATTCEDCLKAGFKYCVKCGSVKPLNEFSIKNSYPYYMCKDCERAQNRAYSKKLYAKSEVRRSACKEACKKSRIADKGARANSAARKYYASEHGKQVNNEASKRYYATPGGRAAVLNRCHKRRLLLAEADGVTADEWQVILKHFNNACAYCGATSALEQDHVVAVSTGGKHVMHNIVPACKSCNSSKGAKDMHEWYESKSFYNEVRLQKIKDWGGTHES